MKITLTKSKTKREYSLLSFFDVLDQGRDPTGNTRIKLGTFLSKIVQIVSIFFFEFKSYSSVLSLVLSFSLLWWTTLYTLLTRSSIVGSLRIDLLKLVNDHISINALCSLWLTQKDLYIEDTFHETIKSMYLKPECEKNAEEMYLSSILRNE